jgi:uncharacterized protein with GYD domain
MPKYLIEVSYTVDGVKGLMKDGGTKRRAALKAAVESLGGKLDLMYYTFGKNDVIAVVDMPDATTMAAAAMVLAASGAVTPKTTVLLTPEEMDQAVKKQSSYTPPGR